MTERILFITSTRIGDAVLASGVLNKLVDRCPEARFTVACGPLAAPLFEHVPRLERVIPMPKQRFGWHWVKLWTAALPHTWTLVVDIRRSLTGYVLRHDQVRRLRPTVDDRHRVALLSTIIGSDEICDPHVYTGAEHANQATELLGPGPVLGLGLGASRRDKIWPADRFVSVARALMQSDALKGGRIALFGGPGEEPLGALFADQAEDLPVTNLVGRTHLLTAHACFQQLALFIGNDSGLMHLAASAGCPTLGLFGQTNGRLYGPWGASGRYVQAPAFGPMGELDADDVIHAANALLSTV